MAESTCTPEAIADLAERVGAGATIPMAADAAGYKWTTVKNWLAYGKQGREPFATFVAAMAQAKAKRAALCVNAIVTSTDWKAHAWFLEKTEEAFEPARFKHEISGPGGGPIQLESMPLDSLLALARGEVIDTEGESVEPAQITDGGEDA